MAFRMDKLTVKAQEALGRAQDIAAGSGHSQLEPLHLLAGLLAETDGVVITHDGFGATGTAAPPFNLGRTTTHEIGHWLDLYYIWGDDGAGCWGTDNVDDTPNQGGSNIGCPTFPA